MADAFHDTTTGDTAREIRLDILDFPKDPAAATCTFKMVTEELEGGTVTTKVNGSAGSVTELVDHLDGTWDFRLAYVFTAANLDTADDYLGQWTVTFSDTKTHHFPFSSTQKMKIKVNAAL